MKYPLFKVHIDTALALKKIKKVLDSGFLNEGEDVIKLEEEFKKYFNHKNLLALNSCTSGLTLALKLSNVGHGDEVITTAMTCVATNMPICNLGAKPIWADINKYTGNISSENIEKLITEKTKALVCVNWAGLPCDLHSLQHLCKKHGIKLIQDAAHSLGSLYFDKHTCHFSDFTCYSLQAIKHITSGDGGILICNNDEDLSRAKKLKWFGIDREASKDEKGEWKGQRWDTDIHESGHKFHMNNITASIGLSQIPHMDWIVSSHKKNASTYSDCFKNNSIIQELKKPKDCSPSYWVYSVLLNEKINRDRVLEKLNSSGVNAGVVHIPNHNYTCFKSSFRDLPETEYFSKHQLSLPCGWWLSNDDIHFIAKSLIEVSKEEYDKYYWGNIL